MSGDPNGGSPSPPEQASGSPEGPAASSKPNQRAGTRSTGSGRARRPAGTSPGSEEKRGDQETGNGVRGEEAEGAAREGSRIKETGVGVEGGNGAAGIALARQDITGGKELAQELGWEGGEKEGSLNVDSGPLIIVSRPLPKVLLLHTGGTLGMELDSFSVGTDGHVSVKPGTGGTFKGTLRPGTPTLSSIALTRSRPGRISLEVL